MELILRSWTFALIEILANFRWCLFPLSRKLTGASGGGGSTAVTKNKKGMYYILFYKTVEGYVEKRAPYRAEHLALAKKAFDEGSIVMAGALAEPADGALLVFKGDGPQAAEAFVQNDPYVKNGLIKEWYVRPWTVVVGGE